jgi:hypothetical protein
MRILYSCFYLILDVKNFDVLFDMMIIFNYIFTDKRVKHWRNFLVCDEQVKKKPPFQC